MTDETVCPCCHQPVSPDEAKIEKGSDGFIVAASIIKGLGPPLVDAQACTNYSFSLNGEPVDEVVAFDRRNGLLWHYQKNHDGALISRGGRLLIEQLKGIITLKVRQQ